MTERIPARWYFDLVSPFAYPYQLMMTPYEKLKSLPEPAQYLKPGITFQQLDAQASAISDNEAAQRLNDARVILFKTIFNRPRAAA